MVDFNEYHNNLIAIFDPFQEPKFFSPMPNATDFMGSIDLFSYEMANYICQQLLQQAEFLQTQLEGTY